MSPLIQCKWDAINSMCLLFMIYFSVFLAHLRFPKCFVKDSLVSTEATFDRAKSCNSGKWEKAALCRREEKSREVEQVFYTITENPKKALPVGRWFCRSAVSSSRFVWGRFLFGHWSQSQCKTSACPATIKTNQHEQIRAKVDLYINERL